MNLEDLPNCNVIDLNSIQLSVEDVLEKLQSLDYNTQSAQDGVPNYFLQACATSLAEPLTVLFNKSLSTSIFPSLWKKSLIIPIYKNGCRSKVENYRGISLIAGIPKLMESLVTPIIFHNVKNVICDEQHGFYKGRSSATNLTVLSSFIVDAFTTGYSVDCIYTDFSKAFDKVNISRLLKKLENLGIGNPLLSWLANYLTDRTQNVRVGDVVSGRVVLVHSGVPQGSHLGPVLFSIYINDIAHVLSNCKFLLFADDLKIFHRINSAADCNELQRELNHFVIWCKQNDLTLNIGKCKSMTFTRKKEELTRFKYKIGNNSISSVSFTTDLGIVFDTKMNFSLHIDYIVNKARRSLSFLLRQTDEFNNARVMLILYKTIVRSVLEYCSIVWSPYYKRDIERVERIQRKFIKYMCHRFSIVYHRDNYVNILNYFSSPPLYNRRIYFDLCFIYKIMNNLTSCRQILELLSFPVVGHSTRVTPLLKIPICHTNYSANATMTRLSSLVAKYHGVDYLGVSYYEFRCQLYRALTL